MTVPLAAADVLTEVTVLNDTVEDAVVALPPANVSVSAAPAQSVPVTVKVMSLSSPPDVMRTRRAVSRMA